MGGADTLELLSGEPVDLVEVLIPEHEDPVILGTAVCIVYRDAKGEEYQHDFPGDMPVFVSAGIVSVVGPIGLSDLGIVEDDGTDDDDDDDNNDESED